MFYNNYSNIRIGSYQFIQIDLYRIYLHIFYRLRLCSMLSSFDSFRTMCNCLIQLQNNLRIHQCTFNIIQSHY